MKKKIIVSLAFCVLILATAIVFIVSAIDTYRMEMNDDILKGFGACMVAVVGGFIVCYECDLFYTVYYLFCRQKRKGKTVFVILSNITLLMIFMYFYLSDVYMELRKYKITPLVLFAVYIVFKIVVLFFSTDTLRQESE